MAYGDVGLGEGTVGMVIFRPEEEQPRRATSWDCPPLQTEISFWT